MLPFGAIASENQSLSQALEALPRTMRQANTTFVNLRAALDVNDVAAVVQLWPDLRSDPRAAPYAVRVHALIQDPALAAIGFAVSFCVVGAFLPARRAARMEPAQVLSGR